MRILKRIDEEKKLIEDAIKLASGLKSKFSASGKIKLEELVKKENIRPSPAEQTLLEEISFIFFSSQNKKANTKMAKPFPIQFSKKANSDSKEIMYSIELKRKKETVANFAYSVSIKYEENENEEKLDISFAPLKGDKRNKGKKEYSIAITRERINKNAGNYSISLFYKNDYEEERLSISYKHAKESYINKRQEAIHDFTDRGPGKHLNTFPSSGNEGLYGFTYLGDVRAWRRDDLIGTKFAKMVDVHESIHTPNEYETRILTSWMMSKERPKYVK